jgi:hypothetical protein
MTTVKLNLIKLLRSALGGDTTLIPATIDINDLAEFSLIHEIDQDIGELLHANRMVGIIWSVEDVKARRPDLSDEQCWQVLSTMQDHHDCEQGITWDTINTTAEELFGDRNVHRVSRCATILKEYAGGNDPDLCLIDLLTDAMQWCSARDIHFADALGQAEKRHIAETMD